MSKRKPIHVKDESEIMAMVTDKQKKRAMLFGRWPIGWFLRDGCSGELKYYIFKLPTLYVSYHQGHKQRLYPSKDNMLQD